MADPGPEGLRSRLHAAHKQLLSSPDSSLLDPDLNTRMREMRAIVLQLDAEFWLRFDIHYTSWPSRWWRMRFAHASVRSAAGAGG